MALPFQQSSLNNPGLLQPGNIDIYNRPVARNPDGSISTVRSMSANFGKGEQLLPTVVNGKVISQEEALQHFLRTGENLGLFDTPENANLYAQRLHNQQASQYAKPPISVLQQLQGLKALFNNQTNQP